MHVLCVWFQPVETASQLDYAHYSHHIPKPETGIQVDGKRARRHLGGSAHEGGYSDPSVPHCRICTHPLSCPLVLSSVIEVSCETVFMCSFSSLSFSFSPLDSTRPPYHSSLLRLSQERTGRQSPRFVSTHRIEPWDWMSDPFAHWASYFVSLAMETFKPWFLLCWWPLRPSSLLPLLQAFHVCLSFP